MTHTRFAIPSIFIISFTIAAILLFSAFNTFFPMNSSGGNYPIFPLDDSSALYRIEKGKSLPIYNVVYEKNGIEQRAFVGSTQVSLDEFINAPVVLEAEFRSKAGKPLCYADCPENIEASLVDIRHVRTASASTQITP